MSSVTFSTAVGGDGSTVTDDDNATTGLGNGGALIRLVPMMQQVVNVASYVVSVGGAASSDAIDASASADAAAASASASAASYDSFDDRYLGAKTSNPTLDNDGNALLTGALYWNTASSVMKVWSGSAWVSYNPAISYLPLSGGTMTGAITFAAGQDFPSTGASIRPSLLLDFANSGVLDPRITFTRASTATYTGYDGLIKTAASGEARFDHNPTTGESLGLLIEEQRTNLLTYSEQFDNAAWSKNNATVTANATTAPDGTATADKLAEASDINSFHFIFVNSAFGTGTNTLSMFAKSAENSVFELDIFNSVDGTKSAFYNLTTGTVNSVNGSNTSATMVSVGNGWYRCSITTLITSSNTRYGAFLADGSSNTIQFNGDGTSGIYIWGAQLEQGSFATSYIPTISAQVTRAADNAVMTGTNFSSWYRQDEGTVFVKADSNLTTALNVVHIDDGTSNNRIALQTVTNSEQFVITTGGVNQAQILPLGSVSSTNNNLLIGSYALNNAGAASNGNPVTVDTSCSIPTVSNLRLGGNQSTTQLNGHIAKLSYYPKRLSNAELQAITTQ